MSKHEWHKFKAGERAWSLPLGEWVTLQALGSGRLGDGFWAYDENGIAAGVSVPVPTLFRNEVKPEDWPQPEPPLRDLKDGDPIWVRDGDEQRWRRGVFAKFDSRGNVLTYASGNKWTSNGVAQAWLQYRIPTPEELQCE